MNTISTARALLCGALCTGPLLAQSANDCPDMDVRPVKATYDMASPGDRCGVSLSYLPDVLRASKHLSVENAGKVGLAQHIRSVRIDESSQSVFAGAG